MLSSKICVVLMALVSLTLNAFPQLNERSYLVGARNDIANSNYFDAIQKLDICLEENPGEYEAYFFRGICKYNLKDNLGAEQDLNKAINMYDPYLYDAFHYRSLVKYRLGDFTGSISDINQVIAVQGTKSILFLERAFSKLAIRDFNGAITDCNRVINLKLYGENVYICKGMAEHELGKFDTALVYYEKALKINAKNYDTYVRIGVTDTSLGKYQEAIEQFTHALKLDSACTMAYFNRAVANTKINKEKDAMQDYNMVIKYDPLNSLAYYNRGVLEANKANYTASLADFDKVLLMNPKNIQALFNRAKLKSAVKDYKGALIDYNKTIELFPYFVEAYYDRAKLKEYLHDYTGSKIDYNLGKVMSEVSHSSNGIQRTDDSITLSHLMALNADFSDNNQKISDSINIDLIPLFYIAIKDKNNQGAGYFPLVVEKNKLQYGSFCLTNKVSPNQRNVTDSSINALNKEAKNSLKKAEILLQIAVIKTNMQLFNDAVNNCNKFIECDTDNAIGYFARGVALCKEVEMLNRFNEDDQPALINKSYRLVNDQKTGKYNKALADFSKTISKAPDFVFAYYNRAFVKYKMGDYKGSVEDYTSSIKLNPDMAEAFYNRGLLLFCLNDRLNAYKDFSKAGELGIKNAYVLINNYCTQVIK